MGSSGQEGGLGNNASFPCITKRRITTNLKTKNKQNCPKIKLPGTPTTKEINIHPDWLEGWRQADRWRGCPARQQTVQARQGLVGCVLPHSRVGKPGGIPGSKTDHENRGVSAGK